MKRGIGTISLVAFGLIAASPAGATDWSGPYVGGNVGYGWGKGDTRFTVLPDSVSGDFQDTKLKPKPKGLLVGPQLGYNWQNGRLLYGIEGDISWSDMDGMKKSSPVRRYDGTPYAGTNNLATGQDIKWLSTVRGRIGFVPSDAWIGYFTAGAAIAKVKYTGDVNFVTMNYPASLSKTKTGWTAGLGAEWAFADQWSAKAEYLCYDLGRASKTGARAPVAGPYEVKYKWDTKGQIVRLGVNYHFGAPKPAAVVPPPPPPVVEEVKPVVEPPPPPPPVVEEVKPVVVAPPPPPPPAKIVLDQAVLHFANNQNKISPEGVAAVQKVAEELKQYPGEYSLVVSGHTSSIGGKAYNKALSKRRADAVAKVLVDSGIPEASIETVGMGPDQPIEDNATKAGQARNRRVEIEVKVKDATVETRTIQTEIQD